MWVLPESPQKGGLADASAVADVVSSDEDRRHVTVPTENAESPGRRTRHCQGRHDAYERKMIIEVASETAKKLICS